MLKINKGNIERWREKFNEAVFSDIKHLIEQTKLSPRLRKLTQRTVSEYICTALLSCTHYLALKHYAVTGKWKPAVPIAAVCTIIWAGAHCFEDLNDCDLSTQWEPDHASAAMQASKRAGYKFLTATDARYGTADTNLCL